MAYLDQYFDSALDVDLGLTPELVAEQELKRISDAYSIACAAAAIPRRLSEASREELALDKRRSRRVAHALYQSGRLWKPDDGTWEILTPTDEQRRKGAVIRWSEWWQDFEPALVSRRHYLATWGKKSSYLHFGKTAVARISNEYDWLSYALR